MDVAFLTEQGHKIRKLPRWMCLLNPLTAKVLLNAVAVIAPNTALSNGLGMANMALGGMIPFLGLLLWLPGLEKPRRRKFNCDETKK